MKFSSFPLNIYDCKDLLFRRSLKVIIDCVRDIVGAHSCALQIVCFTQLKPTMKAQTEN
ncbi:MAG: hypothetical protein CLLPBCKN_004110 [Chroococcidiopsis cubana SAG 39.79]|nr:hypothetical protein [Chroococcidiopsis cubana SAG 39.79]